MSAWPDIPELGREGDSRVFSDLETHPEAKTYPGVTILRFDGGLTFVNAGALGDRLREVRLHSAPDLRRVIINMAGVNFIDTEGADILKKIAQSGLDRRIDFHLARVKPHVLEILERDGAIELIGTDRIHPDVASAVEMHLKRYSPS